MCTFFKGFIMEKTTDELLDILGTKKSIEDFFKEEIDELVFSSLSEYLNLLINEKKLKKNEIIKKSNLDRNYAYQLFNGNKDNPSRDKIIMLAFGMNLTVNETRKLLKITNSADLYARNPRDCILIHCLNNSLDLLMVNEYLHDYNFEILE